MKRIVEQETGLRDAQPERIVMVEEVGPYWFRFTYHVTFDQRYQKNINSHLKQKRDEYSIKASVWKLKEIQDLFVNLRDESIITVLKEFRNQVKRREELNRNSIHKAPIRAPYQYEDQCINPLKVELYELIVLRFCSAAIICLTKNRLIFFVNHTVSKSYEIVSEIRIVLIEPDLFLAERRRQNTMILNPFS